MPDQTLVYYDAARKALEKAATFGEVKKIRDKAEALRQYARQSGESLEMQNRCAEIKLRAERRAGELLEPINKGRPKKMYHDDTFSLPQLSQMGISRLQSSRWKTIAKLPEPLFEQHIAETKEKHEELTSLDVRKIARTFLAEQKQEKMNEERREKAKVVQLHDRIIIGDFREMADAIPDGSLSLIFTDPPYDRESEKLFPGLADFAARKLTPGGSLLFYAGHLQLPSIFDAFNGKLRHWWTCACIHQGDKALMREYGIRVGWKPIIWYVKETRHDKSHIVFDTVSGTTEKTHHDWQQAESEASYWIDALCPVDGIVCDPFLGGGTTAIAAEKLGREWFGFELDAGTAAIASQRING